MDSRVNALRNCLQRVDSKLASLYDDFQTIHTVRHADANDEIKKAAAETMYYKMALKFEKILDDIAHIEDETDREIVDNTAYQQSQVLHNFREYHVADRVNYADLERAVNTMDELYQHLKRSLVQVRSRVESHNEDSVPAPKVP